MPGYIPKTVLALVEPAVQATAARLFVLTTGRAGSARFRPTVATFYETGLVTALYEQLLMSPVLRHLEIRHEMPYHGPVGAPKQVDLWIRHVNGAHPQLIEAGDFSVGKVHNDLAKVMALNPRGANWFLAFFRDEGAADPWSVITASLARANGPNATRVAADRELVTTFSVYRPNDQADTFGAALLRGL